VALAALVPVGLPIARSLPPQWATPIAWLAYGWMGLGFLLVVSAFLSDVAHLVARGLLALRERRRRDGAIDPQRRLLLARGSAGLAAIGAVGMGGVALRGGLGEVEVVEVPVPLERLPAALDGMSIVQLTDVH